MATFDTLRYEVADGLARLTLDRPEHRNAMTNRMVAEATRALELAAVDESLRVLVLTGAGDSFCPGADLNHFTSGEPDDRLTERDFAVASLLHEIPAVTVAAVNGACAGAGLGWALACDLRVMTASAKCNTAFLDVAVAGDMGIPWSLPRIVGAGRARDLSFLPRRVTAAEALDIGLIGHVVPDGTALDKAYEIAEVIAGNGPLAVAAILKTLHDTDGMTEAEALAYELDYGRAVFDSDDAKEGPLAFTQKRKPNFQGK